MFSSVHVPRIVRSRSHTPQNMHGTSAHCLTPFPRDIKCKEVERC